MQYFFLALVTFPFYTVSTLFSSALWGLAGMEVLRNGAIATFFQRDSFFMEIKLYIFENLEADLNPHLLAT